MAMSSTVPSASDPKRTCPLTVTDCESSAPFLTLSFPPYVSTSPPSVPITSITVPYCRVRRCGPKSITELASPLISRRSECRVSKSSTTVSTSWNGSSKFVFLQNLIASLVVDLSRYFQRRISNLWDGRANRTAEVAELEHLTHEVIALKEKLEEPISSGVTSIVLFFENFRRLPWDHHPSTDEQINLVRRKIQELRSQIKQRSS